MVFCWRHWPSVSRRSAPPTGGETPLARRGWPKASVGVGGEALRARGAGTPGVQPCATPPEWRTRSQPTRGVADEGLHGHAPLLLSPWLWCLRKYHGQPHRIDTRLNLSTGARCTSGMAAHSGRDPQIGLRVKATYRARIGVWRQNTDNNDTATTTHYMHASLHTYMQAWI